MNKTVFIVASLLCFSSLAFAQEFEVRKYDVNARVDLENHAVETKTRLSLVNLSGPDLADKILMAGPDGKPKLSFQLNGKAKVAALTLNGAPVQFAAKEDTSRTGAGLQNVSTEINSSLAALRDFEVEFTYTIPMFDKGATSQSGDSSRGGLLISSLECFALPTSFWIPARHSPYGDHGADTAPFTLTVTAPAGLKVISSGLRKADGVFEQSYAAQPFFLAGDYDIFAAGAAQGADVASAPKVEVFAPRGLDEAGKQQAQRITAEAAKMIDFYTKYFGGLVGGTFRIVSSNVRERDTAITGELVSRGMSFSAPGVVAVPDSLFHRNALDLGTIELLASAAARQWIDGRVLLRGRGTGVLRDALPIYLTAQYLGERFGAQQREAAFERYRRAYAPVARGGDAPLALQSPLDRGYTTSVYNKGALVWRIFEKRLGKPALDTLIRQSLDRQRTDVLTLTDWRSPLCAATRCASLKSNLVAAAPAQSRQMVADLFAQWIENVILPDIAVGQPQAGAAGVESTVTNFGNGDFPVEVVATTDKGEKLRQTVMVKASEFGSVTFPAGTQIKVIEADPERTYIQKDYTNDVFPRRPASADLYGQAALAFSKATQPSADAATKQTELGNAEAKARAALSAEPDSPTLLALLGRILLAAGKNDEAGRALNSVLKSEPLPIQAYGYALLGLGELAMQQNNSVEAARRFREAAASDLDQPTVEAARDGALRAERAANAVRIPDDVKAFLQKFDAAILLGTDEAISAMLEQGTLRKFGKSLLGNKPTVWVTEPLRAETLDANRIAVDVSMKVKILGKDYSGRALYVISRAGGRMVLSEVPVFDVK
jgi:Flp pilus assembly protein TadD